MNEDYDNGIYWEVPYKRSFYSGRNYYLFAILADVRNDGSVEPISQPRGIPEDCSYPYKLLLDRWGMDAHSESYFTLEELLNVKWDEYNSHQGWLKEFMETIEKMKQVDPDPSNVRCVFFFDN